MTSRAYAAYNGADIIEVLDICPDGMVLFLTEDDRYEFIHTDEIEIDWGSNDRLQEKSEIRNQKSEI